MSFSVNYKQAVGKLSIYRCKLISLNKESHNELIEIFFSNNSIQQINNFKDVWMNIEILEFEPR